MMNWLRTKLHNFIFPTENALDAFKFRDDRKMNTISALGSGRHSQALSSDNEPLRFTIYNASGGKIVEISHYDPKTDRHSTSLHVITSDENFGEELGKIAFIELIKKG
jgi:hypothetical protein